MADEFSLSDFGGSTAVADEFSLDDFKSEQPKIKLDPYQAADLASMQAGRGKATTGMESGTELTAALASQLPGDVAALPGRTIKGAGEAVLAAANLPTRIANVVKGQEPGMYGYTPTLEELPRPKLPRFGDTGAMAGIGNVLAETGEQVLPVFAPPEVGLTLPLLGGGGLIARVAAATFAIPILENLPEEVQNAIKVVKDPESTTRDKVEAVGRPAVQSVLAGLMVHGAVGKAAVKAPLENVADRTGQLAPDPIRLRPGGEPVFGAEPLPLPSPTAIAPGGAVSMQLPAEAQRPETEVSRQAPAPGMADMPVSAERPVVTGDILTGKMGAEPGRLPAMKPPTGPITADRLLSKALGEVTHQEISDMASAEAAKYFKTIPRPQEGAVMSGLKLSEEDVPTLEKLRDESLKKLLEAIKSNDNTAFVSEQGKNVWYSGAIEGAKKKGPNYDRLMREHQAKAPPVPIPVPPAAPASASTLTEQPSTTIAGAAPVIGGIDPVPAFAGIPFPDALAQKMHRALQVFRGVLSQRIRARPTRHAMDQLADGGETMATTIARQLGNRIRTGLDDVQDRAASAVIAAKFDPANLPGLARLAHKGGNREAEAAVIYAINHWNQIEPKARQGEAIFREQLKDEQAHSIETEAHDNYLPGIYDTDLWMGASRPFLIGRGKGLSSSFRKGKTYDSPFEAIGDGYVPKSLKLSDLVEHRVRQGQRLINRVEWGNALRTFKDPTDGGVIATDLQKRSRGPDKPGYEVAPRGYVAREILPGRRIAVHESYAKLFDALTGHSAIAEFEPGGLPVGEMALQTAGTVKHGLLLFDTFHASRVAQREMSLKGVPSYRKGLSLLEYSDRDLNAAIAAGEITQDMASYARANRGTANLLMKNGLNVGRIQEQMYSGMVRAIQEKISKEAQAAGAPRVLAEKIEFNKWVFEKMSRGAMMESGLIEFERVQKANPNWTQEQVARKVARDINVFFGNLGRQGLFKSQTMLDLSRLMMLAPQWVESMARTELKAAKGLTIDPIANRSFALGTTARGVRNGLLAYFVGTQLLNQFTRGKFTWDNPEKDHKLDAWIPDLTGKSNGYFLSPFSVVTELSHDLYRNIEKSSSVAEGVGRTLLGKAGPLSRATIIAVMGRYPFGNEQKIVGTWNRAKAAGMALAPVPIPITPAIQGAPPGQMQRQAMSSMGLKTELAGTAQQQVHGLVKDWMRESGDPRLVKRYEQSLQQEFGPSDYTPLRQMLASGDLTKASEEFGKLLPVHGKTKVADALNPFRHPFAGSRINEVKFKRSLTDPERATYDAAMEERKRIWRNYQKMLRGQE